MSDVDVPIFPFGSVVFPHQRVSLCVFEPRCHALVHDVESTGQFGVAPVAPGDRPFGRVPSAGTLLEIAGAFVLATGEILVAAEGRSRFVVTARYGGGRYPRARVRPLLDVGVPDAARLAAADRAVLRLRRLHVEVCADESLQCRCRVDDDGVIGAWQLCALAPLSTSDQRALLIVDDVNERLTLLERLCHLRYREMAESLARSGDRVG